MILLASTSDVLRLVTSSTAPIDVVAGFADLATAVAPGQQCTAISTATTTTVVSAPSGSDKRSVRFLTIRNTHATTANTITLQLYNGSTAYAIYTLVLAAGEALIYDEAAGFAYLSAQGLPKVSQSQGSSAAAVSASNIVVLASDVVNNNAVANTIADITGLSFPVVSGQTFWFEFFINYTAAATTTGARFAVNGPTASMLSYTSQYALTATSVTVNSAVAYDIPAASNATSANTTGNIAWLAGFITPSADGNVIARFASEVLSSAITAKAGSVVRWIRVI
jgi:hypothetical protein